MVVSSAKNELRLKDGHRWTGNDRGIREVVTVFDNRVSSRPEMPSGFDLNKAVVVSFEGAVIRFFDFQTMSGGYYRRN